MQSIGGDGTSSFLISVWFVTYASGQNAHSSNFILCLLYISYVRIIFYTVLVLCFLFYFILCIYTANSLLFKI